MFGQKLEKILFYLLILFLPTQLGKHFWPDFAIVSGIRIDYLSPTLYVTDILVGALFCTWLINKVQRINFTLQFLILFLLFLLLNIYLSQNYLNGLYHLLKLLEFSFVAYYVAMTVRTIQHVKNIFLLLGIGVIGQSLLAVAQFFNQGSLNGIFYLFGERLFTSATPGIANANINGELLLRPYGTFPHPNVLAGFLFVSMVGLLLLFPWMKTYERSVSFVALLLGSSALLLTMSRVAFVIWFLFLMIIFLKQAVKQYGKPFLAVVSMISVIILILITPFGSRILQTSLSEEAFVQRVELTRASVSLFTTQPITGIGLGNFLPALATVATPLPLNLYLQPVHNIFLLTLVEIGFIGFGVFIWFLVKTYKRLFTLIKQKEGQIYRIFVILLSTVLILGSFDHYLLTLQQGQLLFALIIGLSWISIKS